MQSHVRLSVLLFLMNSIQFSENVECIPPYVEGKDNDGVECCKLPRDRFPHQVIYEEFCKSVYFGTMAEGSEGRYCKMSRAPKRQVLKCDDGWIQFFEGLNQFCYKAFKRSDPNEITDLDQGDPCRKEKPTASLVRVPTPSINMFLYVRVLNGTDIIGNNVTACDEETFETFRYFIGLYRKDFEWRWNDYDEKAYSHLGEQGQQLLDYLNIPKSKHFWADGMQIFADGWDNPNEITTNVILSDCGMWRDVGRSKTNFAYRGKHVPNQGFICAYHV